MYPRPDDLNGPDVQHRRGRFVERAMSGSRSGRDLLPPNLTACDPKAAARALRKAERHPVSYAKMDGQQPSVARGNSFRE